MNDCKGLAGLIFGHKFQPRYSTGAPTMAEVQVWDQDVDEAIRAIEASKAKTYIHDACVRCGAVTAERRT
jgi:hypothetical protein